MATSGAGRRSRAPGSAAFDRELAGAGHGARLENDVGLRRRLAGEDQAGGLLLVAERLLLVGAVDDRPSSMRHLHEPQAPSLQP
jgi:hypothetical protein